MSGIAWGQPCVSSIAPIASEEKSADALASGVLQGKADLYLTEPARLDPQVKEALQDMGYREVWILGGLQAVSGEVEATLVEAGFKVRRIAGADRTQTAVAIANVARKHHPEAVDQTYIARAVGDEGDETRAWADSIALGGLAATTGHPVVLSTSGDLSPAVRNDLRKGGATTLIGGPSALAQPIAAQVHQVTGLTPNRIAGVNRADTAVQIGRAYPNPKRAIVIDGHGRDAWQLGFSLAGLAKGVNAPILLAAGDVLTPETLQELKRLELEQLICIGAESMCADARKEAGL